MDNPTFLSLAGIDAINGMVIEALDGDTAKVALLNDWTKPTFDPTVPNVTYVSQAFSTSTLVGQYVGSMTFPYLKRNLNVIFPIPLVYEDPYPTTFIQLQRYFADNYDVQLDDEEFAIAGTSTPLSGTDAIGVTPDGTSGLVTLEALGASLRFTAGSTFSFLPTHPSVPVPLARLFTLDGDIRVATLTDRLETPPHPSDWINVFGVLQANDVSTDPSTYYQSMPLFGSVAALDPSGEDYYYLTLTTIGSA